MGKKLTHDEWQDTKPPFVWLRLQIQVEPLQFDFIEKWLEHNTSDWWYVGMVESGRHTFVFKEEADRVMFKLWAANNPFEEDHGEI